MLTERSEAESKKCRFIKALRFGMNKVSQAIPPNNNKNLAIRQVFVVNCMYVQI